jgi:hypothetical protein
VRERAQLHQQAWLVSGYDVKMVIIEIEIANQLAEASEYSAIRAFQFTAD